MAAGQGITRSKMPFDEWDPVINVGGVFYPRTVGNAPPIGANYGTLFGPTKSLSLNVTGLLTAQNQPAWQSSVKPFFLYAIYWLPGAGALEIYRGYLDLNFRSSVPVPWMFGKAYQVVAFYASAYPPVSYYNPPMIWSYSIPTITNGTVSTVDAVQPDISNFAYSGDVEWPAANNGYPSMP